MTEARMIHPDEGEMHDLGGGAGTYGVPLGAGHKGGLVSYKVAGTSLS